eukprot:CAMPEP_0184648130 /NCGR_PEP_ID=MMETSP0308-20130426/5201_1 /TAXON_ID=38269 /ORGANISM="Gloeochaete witrockiana, Strain SAG 46.84" /LENGTH=201 /DNA_ID=CAMNT_0027079719 /DNA_START=97 /DNA_END=702 /DNA_ORIENTATION=+
MAAFVPSVAAPSVLSSKVAVGASAICSRQSDFFATPVAGSAKRTFSATKESFQISCDFSAPALDLNTPTPLFGGATGGLLSKARVEEYYAITWTAKKEAIFELPFGGAAIMRAGENLLRLSRKEQGIALGAQLKNNFKISDYKIYRVFPTGEVQYLHPKDGVFPEKVNPGRSPVGTITDRMTTANPEPVKVKFSGKNTFDA